MPDAADREDDLALLMRATQAAGDLAMRYFRADNTVWDKSPGNPVSDADLAVDSYLKERLLEDRPSYGWLSEETADAPDRLACDRVWVVDPIDGTRDFIRGRDGWAVSVALVEAGRPVLAALCAPVRGQLFTAVEGNGAYCNGARLAVTGRTELAGLGLPIEPHNLVAKWWPEPWDEAVAVERPNSVALRTTKVASGEADAWLEGRTLNEWDMAAAALILTEAGGVIADRAGQPLRFNQRNPVVVGVVAATPALHGECRRRLNAGLAALAARRR